MGSKLDSFLTERKCAIISDLHIGQHRDISLWHDICLDFSVNLASNLKRRKIKNIIMCGDFFDDRNEINVHTMDVANAFLKNLKDFNIIMLVGNHDAYYKDRADVNSINSFNGWPNITVIGEPIQIPLYNNKANFLPWASELSELPKGDILFAHFEVTSFKLNNQRLCENGLDPINLLEHTPLIFSGHFHKRDTKKYKNGTIYYVGSPYQMNFGDGGDVRGYHILDLKTRELEFIPNRDSPTHVQFLMSNFISNKKVIKNLVETYKDQIDNNFVKILIDKDYKFDIVSDVLSQIQLCNPRKYKTDNIISRNTSGYTNYDDLNISIDIVDNINEFINNIDIKYKEETTQYILEKYYKNLKEYE